MTTYVEFVSALAGASIVGVKRAYAWGKTPPASLNAADLPAMWVQGPEGGHKPIVFQGGASWPTFRARLIVAVLPTGHRTRHEAFTATVTMMDAMVEALRSLDLAKSKPTWTLDEVIVNVAGNEFYAVEADVTASG